MANQIKFSHVYPKLHFQESAELLAVRKLNAKNVQNNQELLEYDTLYYVMERSGEMGLRTYNLPKTGWLIQLIFLGNLGIPFSTLRDYSRDKWLYYQENIGEMFEIVIEGQ